MEIVWGGCNVRGELCVAAVACVGPSHHLRRIVARIRAIIVDYNHVDLGAASQSTLETKYTGQSRDKVHGSE
eukprot:9485000-Pyramimonas_sp.AAC.1